MGNVYFYGKIVSMFGDSFKNGKKGGMNNIFKYMMMSEMMKGGSVSGSSGMSNMLPLLMMGNGGFENMFESMLDFNFDSEDEADEESEDDE